MKKQRNNKQTHKKMEKKMERVKMPRMMMTTLKKDRSWKRKKAQPLQMLRSHKLNSSRGNKIRSNNKMTARSINSN